MSVTRQLISIHDFPIDFHSVVGKKYYIPSVQLSVYYLLFMILRVPCSLRYRYSSVDHYY